MPMTFAFASSNFVRIARGTAIETAAVSMSLWVRRNGAPGTFPGLFFKTWLDGAGPTFVSYGFDHDNADPTQLEWVTGGAAAADVLMTAAGGVPDGVWTHVVGTYNPAGAAPQKITYINGVLSTSKTLTDPIVYDTTPASDLYIGSDDAASPESFNGDIDDCRIYNRALSAAEIATIHAGRGADGIVAGLTGRWPLAEFGPGTVGSGAGTVVDISESRLSGTPTSSPVYTSGTLRGSRTKRSNVSGRF